MNEFNALEFLKDFRKRKGWSLDRLAKELDLHHQTLNKLLSGETKEMSERTKQKIADFLKNIM